MRRVEPAAEEEVEDCEELEISDEEFLRGSGETESEDGVEWWFDLLSSNVTWMHLYRACRLSWTGGMVSSCQGIAASEAMAAMRAHRVPAGAWRETLETLQDMGDAAAQVINEALKPKGKGAPQSGASDD